jgi:hypothetical protein
MKQKAMTTWTKDVTGACERLGRWRQPFAWTAFQLFYPTDSGSLLRYVWPSFGHGMLHTHTHTHTTHTTHTQHAHAHTCTYRN